MRHQGSIEGSAEPEEMTHVFDVDHLVRGRVSQPIQDADCQWPRAVPKNALVDSGQHLGFIHRREIGTELSFEDLGIRLR